MTRDIIDFSLLDNDLLRRHLTKEQYAGLKNLAESNSNATIRFNITIAPDSVDNEFNLKRLI